MSSHEPGLPPRMSRRGGCNLEILPLRLGGRGLPGTCPPHGRSWCGPVEPAWEGSACVPLDVRRSELRQAVRWPRIALHGAVAVERGHGQLRGGRQRRGTFDGKEGRLTFFTNGACQGCTLPNVHGCFPHLTQVARQMQSLGYPASHPPGLVLLDLWDGGHARLFTEEEGGGTVYGVALSAIWGRAGEAYAFAAATLTPATPVVSYQRSPIWTKTYARWVAILKEASVGLNAALTPYTWARSTRCRVRTACADEHLPTRSGGARGCPECRSQGRRSDLGSAVEPQERSAAIT